MLKDLWSSLSRWFLGVTACQRGTTGSTDGLAHRNVEDSAKKDDQGEPGTPADSAGQKKSVAPPRKTTVLIMVAPPKDLQQVLQGELAYQIDKTTTTLY